MPVPRGKKPDMRTRDEMPVNLSTRITVGTREKMNAHIAWINDPANRDRPRHPYYTLEELKALPRSVAQLTETALSEYLARIERKKDPRVPSKRPTQSQQRALTRRRAKLKIATSVLARPKQPVPPRQEPDPASDLKLF